MVIERLFTGIVTGILLSILLLYNSAIAYAVVEPDFHKMFDEHGSIMLLIDPKTGSIEYANKAAASFYGYTIEQLTQMNISQINTLSPEETAKEMQDAVSEQRNYFIFKHKLANGNIRTVDVYSYPYINNDNEFLFSLIHDSTDEYLLAEKNKQISNAFIFSLAAIVFILVVFMIVLFINLKNLQKKNKEIETFNELRQTFIDAIIA